MAIWSRAPVGLPIVTIARARQAKLDGDPGLVYQGLPCRQSESDPAAGLLYQAPPPGYEDGYYGLL